MPWITFIEDAPGYKRGYSCDVSESEAKRLIAAKLAKRGKEEIPDSVKDETPEIESKARTKRKSRL